MDITTLISTTESVYFDPVFLQNIEDHIAYLKTLPGTRIVEVTNHECELYYGDFHGLLRLKSIPQQFHQVITRFNGYSDSMAFRKFITFIYIPDLGSVELIKNLYLTKK